MKKLVVLLIVSLMATAAFAVQDDGTDSFGVYFDTANSNNCLAAAPVFSPISVYLVLMNPAAPTNGFECTVTPTAGFPGFVTGTAIALGGLDVDEAVNGYAVGAASNFPVVNNGCTLITWTYFMTGTGPVEFRITPGTKFQSIPGRPVATGGGLLRAGSVASGDFSLPVATMNSANCPVPTETNTFGAVKSLFR